MKYYSSFSLKGYFIHNLNHNSQSLDICFDCHVILFDRKKRLECNEAVIARQNIYRLTRPKTKLSINLNKKTANFIPKSFCWYLYHFNVTGFDWFSLFILNVVSYKRVVTSAYYWRLPPVASCASSSFY